MTTNQPSYHCITNIGDVNPEEYGGQFVFIDKTGFYDPNSNHPKNKDTP